MNLIIFKFLGVKLHLSILNFHNLIMSESPAKEKTKGKSKGKSGAKEYLKLNHKSFVLTHLIVFII